MDLTILSSGIKIDDTYPTAATFFPEVAMPCSPRRLVLPLVLGAHFTLFLNLSAQERYDGYVLLGSPDSLPYNVPAQGEIDFPLWLDIDAPLGGGLMRVYFSDPVTEWLEPILFYPWEYSYRMDGNRLLLSFLINEHPDTIFQLGVLRFNIDADSADYGQTIQAVIPIDLFFSDTSGTFVLEGSIYASPLCIECQTAINDIPILPIQIAHNAYPNPFNSSTLISFSLPQEGSTSLAIYDVTGRVVRNLFDGPAPSGTTQIMWDGLNDVGERASSGVYFYSIRYEDLVLASKITLLR
jgi:hypothetical protein